MRAKTDKLPYRVWIDEAADAPGTYTVTFRLNESRQTPGTARTPVTQHVAIIRGRNGTMDFDWSGDPVPDATRKKLAATARERLAARQKWIDRVTALVAQVEKWAKELGWATRRIDKKIEDSRVGNHKVPALLMQEGTVRVLLDPIAR